MSKKSKFYTDSDEPTQTEEVVVPERPKIPFSQWFNRKVSEGRLKHYQDEALLIFLKKQGLSEIEDEDQYNRTLNTF
jgi:hypothetical protein